MKIIHKLKYTLLLLFGMFQMVSVKAAFNEDFSSSSLKLPAMFVSKAAIDYKYFNTNNRLNALNNVNKHNSSSITPSFLNTIGFKSLVFSNSSKPTSTPFSV